MNSFPNTYESETIGLVNDATRDIPRRRAGCIVVIIGDEEEKIQDLTLKIASPFVTGVINFGVTATCVMITPSIWCDDWGNKDLISSKLGRLRTVKEMTNL
jgi:hypothetical protein